MILKINGNIYPFMVVLIQKFWKFVCNTFRNIIYYVSTVANEDPEPDINTKQQLLVFRYIRS